MRKLFTSLFALCAAVSMSAQDPSAWTPEQEITDELQWQNVKYTGDRTGWETAGNARVGWSFNTTYDFGSIEMYENPEGAELFQVFWLPAGYFKFTVQGFYRPNNWTNNFNDEYAVFFCDAVEEKEVETEEGDIEYVYTTTRQTSKPMRHITTDAYENGEPLYYTTSDDGSINYGYPTDSRYEKGGQTYWVPNSMDGADLYFSNGMYENELYVVNPEEGYVKIGIRKTGQAGTDWTIFNNFRAFYISDAGEAVQLIIAKENVAKAEAKLTELQGKIADEYGALAALLGDELMELQDGDDYDTTLAGCEATMAKIESLIAQYNAYYAEAKKLTVLLVKCRTLNNAAGDVTFAAAVAAAEDVENNGTGEYEMTIESPEAYRQAYDALAQARLVFLTSQPAVEGAWDFTTMINNPWFCNEEYNPTWNAENGYYEYNPEIEENWVAVYGEKGVPDIMKEHPDWTNIASDVKWTTKKDAVGEWIFNHSITSGWMGGIDNVTMQHGYTAVGAWSADPCGGYQEMRQVITNLPNGFYSMGAYFINAGNDPMAYNQYVYINAGSQPDDETMQTARFTHKGEHWWGGAGNYPLYRTDDWQDLRTNFVRVTDGTCVIGSRSNGFYAVTGFRLFYYGENPDFSMMLAPEVEAIREIELKLAGDRAHVDALLAAVPATISGYEEYEAVRAIVDEAKAYATAANNYMESWDGAGKFMELQANYEAGDDEYDMLDIAWVIALAFPDEPDATYLGAQAIDNDFNAYAKYLNVRKDMLKVAESNAELKALLDEQCAALKANYATAATLASYIEALSAPYNAGLLASLGAANATPEKPVDITQLIVNPDFETGNNTGWETTSVTVDGNWKNAESWNTSAFRIAQTVYALPVGSYRVQVQSFYRDANSARTSYDNYVYNEEYNANVKFFANNNSVDVVSIASLEFYEPSMTERITGWEEDYDATEAWHEQHMNDEDYDPDYKVMAPVTSPIDWDNPVHPFDEMVADYMDLWYPNSMEGTMNRFQKNPEAYINTVEVALHETGNITFGLEKNEGIGGDWCMFDNFKLFYISPDPAVSIGSIAANGGAAASAIYNVNGIRQNTLSRGINIVKMSDGTVKKVFKK